MGLKITLQNGNNANELKYALKKFKRILEKDGIIKDMKKKMFYEKPSEERRRERKRRHKTAQLATLKDRIGSGRTASSSSKRYKPAPDDFLFIEDYE